MKYRTLGSTNTKVSNICLDTMTWGEQNTEKEGFDQMDLAVDEGVNFFDTADLYSVPPRKVTWGVTETIIGNWLSRKKCRDKIIIATKVVGRSGMKWFRNKETRLNKEQINEAINGSLKRLNTDYIDLYQLHWPDRKANFFGKLGYTYQEENDFIDIKTQLEVLADNIKDGKISPWLILNCKSGKEMLSKFNEEQLTMIYHVMDPEHWAMRFKRQPNDVDLVKEVVKESNL